MDKGAAKAERGTPAPRGVGTRHGTRQVLDVHVRRRHWHLVTTVRSSHVITTSTSHSDGLERTTS